jgi:hypothetical protein
MILVGQTAGQKGVPTFVEAPRTPADDRCNVLFLGGEPATERG